MEDVRRENEGLRLKLEAVQDSNKLLKSLKEEGQQEVERLRKAVEELREVFSIYISMISISNTI